ncbi:MAG: hypothetical protein HFP76_07005 [Methylococcales symbiont of Iophon sp. n. MRB-2018]|nr:MAG: hypothetical protein HFP76_07005 [Methylococcales symbiont of Iophon sp. n. MRB-2018]
MSESKKIFAIFGSTDNDAVDKEVREKYSETDCWQLVNGLLAPLKQHLLVSTSTYLVTILLLVVLYHLFLLIMDGKMRRFGIG